MESRVKHGTGEHILSRQKCIKQSTQSSPLSKRTKVFSLNEFEIEPDFYLTQINLETPFAKIYDCSIAYGVSPFLFINFFFKV